jgi:hypothetical protein
VERLGYPGRMKWKAFTHEKTVYDFGHLDPFEYDLVVPQKDDKPERRYRLNVTFSMHCFTRDARKGEQIPAELAYSDSRETRFFEFDRYEQSKGLAKIVRTLGERKCHHDKHGNFYVFEVSRRCGWPQAILFGVFHAIQGGQEGRSELVHYDRTYASGAALREKCQAGTFQRHRA